MTYVKTSVPKPGANKGLGGNKKYNITFFDFDDVATFPARDASGIVIAGNIEMNPNAYMITVYGTIDTIKNNSESGGDIDAEGITQSVIFNHPGNEVEIREFRANWLSRNIGILVEHCSDSTVDLYGSPCAPLRMAFKHDEDKDKNSTEFTLKSSNKGPDVADYQGTITYSISVGASTIDATTLDLSSGPGRYQAAGGSVASVEIETCSNAINGASYTLFGVSGDDYPVVITKAHDFILVNGTTWNALPGSELTFKAFKSDTSAWKFIELSRK